MSVGATPVNQLNSLPLISSETFATTGDIFFVGGTVVRKWSPAQTGINGTQSNVADPHGGAFAYLLSNWLDFSGMRTVTLNFGVNQTDPGGHLDEAVTWTVWVIGAAFIGTTLIEPVAFPPGPDARNLTGAYAAQAYVQVGSLAIPNAGATLAGQFPFSKISTLSFQIGAVVSEGVGVAGPGRIYMRNGAGSTNQAAYLTVYAESGG